MLKIRIQDMELNATFTISYLQFDGQNILGYFISNTDHCYYLFNPCPCQVQGSKESDFFF